MRHFNRAKMFIELSAHVGGCCHGFLDSLEGGVVPGAPKPLILGFQSPSWRTLMFARALSPTTVTFNAAIAAAEKVGAVSRAMCREECRG